MTYFDGTFFELLKFSVKLRAIFKDKKFALKETTEIGNGDIC